MANMKKLLSLLLAVSMLLGVTGAFAEATDAAAAVEHEADTLVIASSQFNSKFSPFYAETAYDQNVVDLTGVSILTTDRTGGIISNAIEGETVAYNGTDYTYTGIADVSVERDEAADTTTYTTKLREGVLFSDGVEMTADDIIFTYYVLLDPSYSGTTTLNSYDIVGLQDYRTQTTSDFYSKYSAIVADIQAAGADYTATDADSFTQEQYDAYQACVATQKTEWSAACQAIVDYVWENYGAQSADIIGIDSAEVEANEGLKVALGMAGWGFGGVADGVFTTTTGKSFTLADEQPTIEDYFDATYAAYEGDPASFLETELAGVATLTVSNPTDAFISAMAATDESQAAGIPNITGIKKIDKYTVSVTLNGFSAPAVYQVMGITVAPMHYYGDEAQYDYDNNQFGHPYGDLSIVAAKTTEPLGAGPYKFVKYENKVVYLEANENYWDGAPKIKNLQLRETQEADKVPGLTTGTLDIADPSATADVIKMIKDANGNDSLEGDAIATSSVDFLGYGYIGMSADNVNVAGEPASDASKNLRRAIMTALAMYRDVVIDSYYGEIASVINYPITNTSWAAPQPTDEGYKVAYSIDVDGNDIFTADMTPEQRDEAALAAIRGFLTAAGYTLDDAGVVTAAPEGAYTEYEVLIGGSGSGDHPSFGILTDAKALLAQVGMTLTINDMSDFSALQERVKSNSAQLWCMAWQSTIDPDMYQVYHSNNMIGAGGTDSNSYMVNDPDLDQLIMDARNSADQTYRKSVYKQALDLIVSWAVELPVYQRQEFTVFSSERINVETLPDDMTTFYGYMRELNKLELK